MQMQHDADQCFVDGIEMVWMGLRCDEMTGEREEEGEADEVRSKEACGPSSHLWEGARAGVAVFGVHGFIKLFSTSPLDRPWGLHLR